MESEKEGGLLPGSVLRDNSELNLQTVHGRFLKFQRSAEKKDPRSFELMLDERDAILVPKVVGRSVRSIESNH
jgi:hypothetical protein